MKNYKLRLAWIIPLIFLLIFNISIIIFTVLNWDGLGSSNITFLLFSILLFVVILFGFYRIRKWIKSGLI
ncbi:hypothetical protein ASD24_23845 [Paenibacillus sp. Root52]|uniref:Membrane protein n=1 Tax=Paenibacillus amylolyticus TaxID=1451 RepID=A0AAP5H5U0_PAEAM|nr:hypothetical protein ASD24_23845 [Paenibacillus sp. Root52]MDR6725561.1 putative membrane protein [Paenibacillus amylolyticus]